MKVHEREVKEKTTEMLKKEFKMKYTEIPEKPKSEFAFIVQPCYATQKHVCMLLPFTFTLGTDRLMEKGEKLSAVSFWKLRL